MITIKDYAEQKGVTTQAVYKQLQTHKEELEGYIVSHGRTRYLLDEAIEILNRHREASPQIIERSNDKELIEQLREENKSLLIKIATQADKISELSEWKSEQALLIAEANQNMQLLTEQKKEVKALEASVIALQKEKDEAIIEATESLKTELDELYQSQEQILKAEYEKQIQILQDELQAERDKSWWQRLWGK